MASYSGVTVDEGQILVHREDQTGWIRVVGKGSFKNAGLLKKFAERCVELGDQRFQVDLGECTYMDSTFMGTLAGIAIRQKEARRAPLQLTRVDSRNRELLETLGLQTLMEINPASTASPSAAHTESLEGSEDKQSIARTMLEAHQNLVKVDQSNAPKFQDVITYLRDKLNVSQG